MAKSLPPIPRPPSQSSDNGDTWDVEVPVPDFLEYDFKNIYSFNGRIFATVFNLFTGNRILFREGGDDWAEISFGGAITNPNIHQIIDASDRLIIQSGAKLYYLELGGDSGAPVIKHQSLSENVAAGDPQTLFVYATGTRPLTYQQHR
ncbi:hypothetical protein V2O64_18185 [Verrucomicrobiaceae bacterium 227]